MLFLLWVMAGVLVLLWLMGVAGAFAVGSWIHLLLVAAVLSVVASLFTRPPRLV
jgi:hypothetical protein